MARNHRQVGVEGEGAGGRVSDSALALWHQARPPSLHPSPSFVFCLLACTAAPGGLWETAQTDG